MTKSLDSEPDNRPAYLIFEFERRAYPIGTQLFTIGRAGSCDIVIREPAVSRIHAEISHSAEGIVIKPFGATPTIVNGAQLAGDATLHHGDHLEIGSAKLTVNEFSLPLGVSIIDNSRKKPTLDDDVDNRRPTITNPILSGRANPNQAPDSRLLRPILLLGLLFVVAAYFFGAMFR
ncbi:MAG: FHA domain-containing protein [Gemmatimonadaceae bacterium]|nr:FHA domain-containing protein [Gemmatimonadaceae bacterium]